MCVFPGNPSQYTGLVHAAVSKYSVAAGGSFGTCGGGDALPTRPVQVHGEPAWGGGLHSESRAIFHSVWMRRQTEEKIDSNHPTATSLCFLRCPFFCGFFPFCLSFWLCSLTLSSFPLCPQAATVFLRHGFPQGLSASHATQTLFLLQPLWKI